MTQPSKWALEKAREIVAQWGGYPDDVGVPIIARALMEAEARGEARGMEKAAKIAENFAETDKARDKYDAWWLYQVGGDIATAIRAGGKNG